MQTQVLMKRELFGHQINQQSKTGYFSATDLIIAGNQWRAANKQSLFRHSDWLKQKSTQDFIKQLEEVEGKKVWKPGRGRGHHSFCHPLLFIDMALAISPQLKIEVYQWLFDNLLRHRNESGESFKKMAGAIFDKISNKSKFQEYIKEVSNRIALACDVGNNNRWEKATEAQLKKRDKIQEDIFLLSSVLKDIEEAVRIAIEKNTKIT